MTTISEFSQLRKLVNQQLDDFETEVKKAGFPLPQITPAEFHPLDDPFYLPSTQLFHTREQLVGSLGMLQRCVQAPAERLMSASFSHHLTSSLGLVVNAGVPEALQELGPGPVSVEPLGKRVKVDADKLLRVLRFLSNQNIFNEASEGQFQHSRTSLLLLPGPMRNFVSFQTWNSLLPSPIFSNTLLDPKLGTSYNPLDSAAALAHDLKGANADNVWAFLAEKHPKRIEEFASAMTAFSSVGVNGLLPDFPWGEISERIVDVGGGEGGLLLPLLKAFPNLSGVIQDRPETVPLAKKNFEANLPEAIKDNRIEFEVHDFFKPQVRKGEGHLFLMRFIIHDYSDENCVKILKHLAEVMTPSSRLLVIDCVIQPAVTDEKDGSVPFPLPKSLGDGGNFKLQIGQEMLQGLNAKERTVKEFSDLFEASGLRLEKVWNCRSPHGIVEARLRK